MWLICYQPQHSSCRVPMERKRTRCPYQRTLSISPSINLSSLWSCSVDHLSPPALNIWCSPDFSSAGGAVETNLQPDPQLPARRRTWVSHHTIQWNQPISFSPQWWWWWWWWWWWCSSLQSFYSWRVSCRPSRESGPASTGCGWTSSSRWVWRESRMSFNFKSVFTLN